MMESTSNSTDMKLSQLVHKEASKSGISPKDARKAYKKLRSGGMMAQIAPQLHNQFMSLNPTLTARDKLRMKIRQMDASRSSKACKERAYEKTREEAKKAEADEASAKVESVRLEAQKLHNHRKRLKNLEKRMGIISQELYNATLISIRENKYTDDGLRNRDKNIIELYGMLQEFSEKIDMNDIDV